LLAEEGVHFGLGRLDAAGHRLRRHQPDGAGPLLEQQRGILLRHALRHLGIGGDRQQHLALNQRGRDLVAKLAFGDVLAGDRGAERLRVELAGEVAEGGDAGDLAVHHPLGRGEAVVAAERQHRLLGDQLAQYFLEGAAAEEGAEVELGLPLARLGELAGDLVGQLRRGHALVADADQLVAAAQPADSGRRVHPGDDEGDHDQAQKAQDQPGGKRAAEEGEHWLLAISGPGPRWRPS
jgi:hypothetical protein